jgi:hypothetical protein
MVQLCADGFDARSRKTLIWHLYEAAIAGRDIYYDQRYAHSLEMRDLLRSDRVASSGGSPRSPTSITIQALRSTAVLSTADGAQVRAEMHAGSVCRGGKRGDAAGGVVPLKTATPTSCCALGSRRSSIRMWIHGHREDAAASRIS